MVTLKTPLCQSGLYEKTLNYWRLSHAWRGHAKEAGTRSPKTIEGLINGLNQNFSMAIHTERLIKVEGDLMQQIIHNKRCRKTKPTQNIIRLADQISAAQLTYNEVAEHYRQQFWG